MTTLLRFADPWYLLLLFGLPPLIYWYVSGGHRRHGSLRYSSLTPIKRADTGGTGRYRHVLFGLRTTALAVLILSFARPQTGITAETVTTEGIDIVLALDLSSSMLAEDLEPNRIEAAKQVAADFVNGRRNDRIGLVVFAGDAFTQAPLTLDYGVVTTVLSQLDTGILEDGTAIGMGLATAVKRLQGSDAVSKVIVLLTDGQNNRGEIDPVTAAQMAQALGIRVYAIGAGSEGVARVPVDDPVFGRRYAQMQVDIDEPTLQETAALTGGQYFRATDRSSLEEIWTEIDTLETTEIDVEEFTRYGELFHVPLLVGVGLLMLELGAGATMLRRLP
ncbi:MAG: VWA domain-containing protein [Acidobacteriota bacterium]|nr:VWA domain-containing protein [Acidobacteriota bacterium]